MREWGRKSLFFRRITMDKQAPIIAAFCTTLIRPSTTDMQDYAFIPLWA